MSKGVKSVVRKNWRRVWLLGLMLKKHHRRLEETMSERDRQRMLQFPAAGLKRRGAWLPKWSAGKGSLGGTKMQSKVSWQKHTNVGTRDVALPETHGYISRISISQLLLLWFLDREQGKTRRPRITIPWCVYNFMHRTFILLCLWFRNQENIDSTATWVYISLLNISFKHVVKIRNNFLLLKQSEVFIPAALKIQYEMTKHTLPT